jgi:hypothetical protein
MVSIGNNNALTVNIYIMVNVLFVHVSINSFKYPQLLQYVLRTFKRLAFVFVLQLAAPEYGRSVNSFEPVVGISVHIKL